MRGPEHKELIQRILPGDIILPRGGAHQVARDVKPRHHGRTHSVLGERRVVKPAEKPKLFINEALHADRDAGRARGGDRLKNVVIQRIRVRLAAQLIRSQHRDLVDERPEGFGPQKRRRPSTDISGLEPFKEPQALRLIDLVF